MKRRFLITYEQARTIMFSLASTVGMLSGTKEPQLLKLREECNTLRELLSSYKWERTGGP